MYINHQLSNQLYYFPTWEIKYLFLGTFNPEGGVTVNYYYGRETNQAWRILSQIFGVNFNPNSPEFLHLLKKHGIACVDMINRVDAPDYKAPQILGQGYRDSAIINSVVIRQYNTEHILRIIEQNPNLQIFSTWGKGSKLKNWREEISKVPNLVPLVSPSLAARVPSGVNKFLYMLQDWSNKIIIN